MIFPVWLKSPYTIIILTQLLFTGGDLLARANLRSSGFTLHALLQWWFLAYFLIRQVAMVGQLYVFAAFQLGKTMALFGATSIVISNLLGYLLLAEVLAPAQYLGVALATAAFLVLALL